MGGIDTGRCGVDIKLEPEFDASETDIEVCTIGVSLGMLIVGAVGERTSAVVLVDGLVCVFALSFPPELLPTTVS